MPPFFVHLVVFRQLSSICELCALPRGARTPEVASVKAKIVLIPIKPRVSDPQLSDRLTNRLTACCNITHDDFMFHTHINQRKRRLTVRFHCSSPSGSSVLLRFFFRPTTASPTVSEDDFVCSVFFFFVLHLCGPPHHHT